VYDIHIYTKYTHNYTLELIDVLSNFGNIKYNIFNRPSKVNTSQIIKVSYRVK